MSVSAKYESKPPVKPEVLIVGYYFLSEPSRCLPAKKIAAKYDTMDELTAPLLRELIDHIEVYETQGAGKSRTQRITIHYRFVGYIDIPAAPLTSHYISETRQGVAVEYIPA